MNIHLIAIGGSAMHNLALELHKKGYQVTGSDFRTLEIQIRSSRPVTGKVGLVPGTHHLPFRCRHFGYACPGR